MGFNLRLTFTTSLQAAQRKGLHQSPSLPSSPSCSLIFSKSEPPTTPTFTF